jgi:hypothetical protein
LCAFCCILRAFFFLLFLLSGAVCVVDLSGIENIGDNQYGESYNIDNKQYASKKLSYCQIYRFLESVTPLSFARYVQKRPNQSCVQRHLPAPAFALQASCDASLRLGVHSLAKEGASQIALGQRVARSAPSTRLYTASTSRYCIFSASLREGT